MQTSYLWKYRKKDICETIISKAECRWDFQDSILILGAKILNKWLLEHMSFKEQSLKCFYN